MLSRAVAIMAWRAASHAPTAHFGRAVPVLRAGSACNCVRSAYNTHLQPWAQVQRCSSVVAAAAADTREEQPSGAAGSAQAAVSARLAQLLKVKLPTYCSGCGVKLQQEDPDAPGYFQIPRRLIDLADEQAELLGAADEDDTLPAEERQRRSADRALESWLDEQQRPAVPAAAGGEAAEAPAAPSVKCARCFSLVNYGKVKSEVAESLLPEFNLAKKVGRKISLQKDRQATVLCVVDVWDFDGSLPREALMSLFPGGGEAGGLLIDPDAPLPFQLAVAVNKFDLLPSQATAQRVQQWVRTRLQQAGLPRPDRVFMVSALNGLGVKEMLRTLRSDMGLRADLWVVGAQNAGKSSLIAAMKRLGGTAGSGDPTIAPVPGTTLGLIRVPGIPLGTKHRTFDTPGVRHPYQLTSMLNLAETQVVLPRRRLKPRTYRIPAGSSILIGGLARIDVISAPSATLYVTLFVSDEIVTHLGKTEGAEERRLKHTGTLLAPPYEPERLQQLPPLVKRSAIVEGDSWKQHSRDIAIAGLGWASVGCEGAAQLEVWTPQGVMVTLHDALIPDFAKDFQKPGFSHLLPQTAAKGSKPAAAAVAAAPAGRSSSSSSSTRSRGADDDDEDDEEEESRGAFRPASASSSSSRAEPRFEPAGSRGGAGRPSRGSRGGGRGGGRGGSSRGGGSGNRRSGSSSSGRRGL